MNCSTYDAFMPYVNCQVGNIIVPAACFLIVVVGVVKASKRLAFVGDDPIKPVLRTRQPLKWKLGAWLMLIPGAYSIMTMLSYVFSDNVSKDHHERPKGGRAAPSYDEFFGFVLYLLMAWGSMVLSFFLFGFWVLILQAISKIPKPKPQDLETGTQMTRLRRTANRDTATPQTEPYTTEERPPAAMSAPPVDYDIPSDTDKWKVEAKNKDDTPRSNPSTVEEPPSNENDPTSPALSMENSASPIRDSFASPETTHESSSSSSDTSETSNWSIDPPRRFSWSDAEVLFDNRSSTPPLSRSSTISESSSSGASLVHGEYYIISRRSGIRIVDDWYCEWGDMLRKPK
ncbi:MAG: hypothetical protein Q9191_006485 [Dirinaria sp. TL-2023a]